VKLSLSVSELKQYIERQLDNMFPDGKYADVPVVALDTAIQRCEYNFTRINNAAYSDEAGQSYFNHLHSDQYSMLLYFIGNEMYRQGLIAGERSVCDKLTLLNRTMSGAFIPYKITLPDIFFWGHPVGTVLGYAEYSNYLILMQNITVSSGTDYDNIKASGETCPVLGEYLQLCSGSKIVGRPIIGDNVTIGVNAVCHGQDIPDNCTLYADKITGTTIIKERNKPSSSKMYFREKSL
jgi:serine O-acetyltransferase